MKTPPQLAILAVFAMAACTKAPDPSESRREVDERLQNIEGQLARIEKSIAVLSSDGDGKTTSGETIKIYVSGQVVKPGQYDVENDISLLAALAVAGGPTDYADVKRVRISRRGQKDRLITDQSTFKDVILEDKDVVIVPQSSW